MKRARFGLTYEKVENLEIEEDQRDALLAAAEKAMLESVKPATEPIASVEAIAAADTKDGAWKFPEGEAFYNNALAQPRPT